MKVQSSSSRLVLALVAAASAAALTGCYVVPTNQYPTPQPVHVQIQSPPVQVTPQPPASVTFAARLYPSNDLAQSYGLQSAVVTNDMNGRGTFSVNINGEFFTGEGTRVVSSVH
jgi:hypothetical protein